MNEIEQHIELVQDYMHEAAEMIIGRGTFHDLSKLQSPEFEIFGENTSILAELKYPSPEYDIAKAELGIALSHHYENNSHHPEHYENGINGMSLFDILEMLMDHKAASEKTKNGSIQNSLDYGRERFGYSDQLYKILQNTAREMGWM